MTTRAVRRLSVLTRHLTSVCGQVPPPSASVSGSAWTGVRTLSLRHASTAATTGTATERKSPLKVILNPAPPAQYSVGNKDTSKVDSVLLHPTSTPDQLLNWVEISASALQHNLNQLRRLIGPNRAMMIVAKNNCYGCGASVVAPLLWRFGVRAFAVATVSEATGLLESGIPILPFRPVNRPDQFDWKALSGPPLRPTSTADNTARDTYTATTNYLNLHKNCYVLNMGLLGPGEERAVVQAGIAQAVFRMDDFNRLMAAAAQLKRPVRVHIKVDTGMRRLGILDQPTDTSSSSSAAVDFVRAMTSHADAARYLRVEGVMTNLAEDSRGSYAFDRQQFARINAIHHDIAELLREFRENQCAAVGLTPPDRSAAPADLWLHASSSDAVFTGAELTPVVRCGCVLYGLYPSARARELFAQQSKPSDMLRPVLSLKARVVMIKPVSAGDSIGYGRNLHITADGRVAIISIGHFDGLDARATKNGAMVVIRGRRYPLGGTPMANLSFVVLDNSIHAASIKEGDEVVLIGRDRQVPLDSAEGVIKLKDMSEWSGLSEYQVLPRINPNVTRVLTD